MQSMTSEITIRVMRNLFTRHGLPLQVVSDNGRQFVSGEFQTFLKKQRHSTRPHGIILFSNQWIRRTFRPDVQKGDEAFKRQGGPHAGPLSTGV